MKVLLYQPPMNYVKRVIRYSLTLKDENRIFKGVIFKLVKIQAIHLILTFGENLAFYHC